METSNSVWIVVAVALTCLVGGFLFLRVNRKDNPDIDMDFLESRHFPDDPEPQIDSHRSPSKASQKAGNPAMDLLGDVYDDPVAGASVLLQAGRKKEAEQVLIRASLASPDRNDTLLALLDLYISSRDEKGVTGVMCLLKTKTSADGPERERATRAFKRSGIKWSAEMQQKFDNLVEKASSEI